MATATHRTADGLARAARGMLAQKDSRVINSLPAIVVPTLIVVGANDTPFLAATDYMAAKIPGAKKVIIPDAGHSANLDQPHIFNAAVVDFLARLPV
jgi:pimeloyl-ACP methyl ester carboxylesterase